MPAYVPPIDDVRFLLTEVFDFDGVMGSLGATDTIDSDLAVAALTEAGRFSAEVLQPLNGPGDWEGCRIENGQVITPAGFPAAYRAFAEAGWASLSGDPAFGGQGLPRVVQILLDEMVAATNMAFGLFPGLTRGAVEALARHADAELKAAYLPRMISGEWTGAMALTEAHAGTDLGLLTTRAVPTGTGSYAITGSKIFISSGDQDFGGNIIHLVLARLPDAPAGVKGISLFLVPKQLPGADGKLGARNGMSASRLEHKMGIHAQPTCAMEYEAATGWLVGEPHRGLNAMFTMMNAERLFVGIQGLGLAAAAYQGAAAYAKERRQGRAPEGGSQSTPILAHPDVRKMLLTIRAFVEGGRALAVWTALQMDIADRHPDPATRQEAEGFVALLTPIIKAAFTDLGFEATVLGQQVFGGHGYIREWGMEQLVRDARITQIYEGTNGIQALDLVGRKLGFEKGQLPHHFFALVETELNGCRALEVEAVRGPALAALASLRRATDRVQSAGANTAEIGSAATDYLRLFALVALGWMWTRMADRALAPGREDAACPAKVAVAEFFVLRLLPQVFALETGLQAGAGPIMAMPAESF